ncbi:signal recognition particle 14kD protein [Ustulina deusta]|nr:signal recognition particle 14kD protein [Ustulina deusta]
MGHLSNDKFFARLVELFDSAKGKDHGSIVLTQKRRTTRTPNTKSSWIAILTTPPTIQVSYGQPLPEPTDDAVLSDQHPPHPLPILIRATNGKGKEDRKANKKIKLSTVVDPDALPAFFERYAEICKQGMGSLKPRDRSRRKGKAKKKSKTVATTTMP